MVRLVTNRRINGVLTVKLDEKLACLAIPYANGTVLTACQDVVAVSIDRCYRTAMRLANIPEDSFRVDCVETA